MSADSGACTSVARGGVGESGASALLIHSIKGPHSKMIVLRNVESSLCPNTWALASLFVNGTPMASGNISTEGSSIQVEVSAGGSVAALIQAVPNFNRVSCVRLGEASINLEECDLVSLSRTNETQAGVISTSNIVTRDWYAWNNTMPPKPDQFHLVGEVQVPNPGVDVVLLPRIPQGFNPRILLMEIHLHQRPGIWPQFVVWKPVSYSKVNGDYDSVRVFHGNDLVVDTPVEVVQ